MAHAPRPNTSSHPPLWRWNGPKSGGTPPGRKSGVEDGRLPFSFRRMPGFRNWYKPMWIEVRTLGPLAEIQIEIRCREWRYQFPGHVSLTDALRVINGHPSLDELLLDYRHRGEREGGGSGPLTPGS